MKLANRSAITIYGTEGFLEWIKTHHKNLQTKSINMKNEFEYTQANKNGTW